MIIFDKFQLNKKELNNYLKDKNVIFLMLSDTEGMPNTVSDAIQKDMFVISRDIGDVKEIIPSNNIVSSDYKKIFNRIKEILVISNKEWDFYINLQRKLLKKYIYKSDNDFNALLKILYS